MNEIGERIQRAAEEQSFAEISYKSSQGTETERIIRPLELRKLKGRSMLRAYCYLRQEERMFRLDRIVSCKDVDPSEVRGTCHTGEVALVHFPVDVSIGHLYLSSDLLAGMVWGMKLDDRLGRAQGKVLVPLGKKLALMVYRSDAEGLSPLRMLGPRDLHGLYCSMGREADLTCTKRFAELEWLQTSGITDSSAEHLRGLTQLRVLMLSGSYTDAGLANLSQMTALQRLKLTLSRITDDGLVHLEGMADLPFLDLFGTSVGDSGLIHLQRMPSLRYLDLRETQVGDRGLARLGEIHTLEVLMLGVSYGKQIRTIGDDGLSHIRGLSSLKWLGLKGLQISDAGLAHLAELTGLEWLDLSQTNITDKGLAHLRGLKNLQELDLFGTAIGDTGMSHLRELPALGFLSVRGTSVTMAGLEKNNLLHSIGPGGLIELTGDHA